MYVYIKNLITDKYDVGYFAPDGTWQKTENASYKNPEYAARKVHYLNGGKAANKWEQIIFMFNDWGARLAV